MNDKEREIWELVVDDVWDNEQRMTPEKRNAILAAAARLQALEAAAAGLDPAERLPEIGQLVLTQQKNGNFYFALRDGDKWRERRTLKVLEPVRWWRLPDVALDGETATNAVD